MVVDFTSGEAVAVIYPHSCAAAAMTIVRPGITQNRVWKVSSQSIAVAGASILKRLL